MSYTVTRYHDISCGHRVYGHEGKCSHLHGHNYRIRFTVERVVPGLDSVGGVADFSVIKSRLCEWLEGNWDHKLLLWVEDPLWFQIFPYDEKGIVRVSFNPTAENMAEYLVAFVGPKQLAGTGVKLTEVTVEETAKCSATYRVNEP